MAKRVPKSMFPIRGIIEGLRMTVDVTRNGNILVNGFVLAERGQSIEIAVVRGSAQVFARGVAMSERKRSRGSAA